MSNITVKFIGKEYSVPEDILTYIDLLDFTDNVQKQLTRTFVRKLRNEIAKDNIGLLDDEDLANEIEQQVGKYIAKLCDNGVYTRTISDYLKNNKGYQLYSEVNKTALEKMKSLLIREMDEWQAGYEQAVNKADSHVTGMGFSIWSSSFVNHAIYAAMEASTLNKQGKEAEAQYQKDMNDLRSRLNSRYGGEKSDYINNTYIPNMEAALTVFAYELLDKYVADLIANGKFDGKTLDYVDISRSNDLLKNLTLSNNKQAILENAFAACPYNIAVYMQAMKYDFLDYDSFQTAKIFKQDKLVLSFLKESWGEVSYPTKFDINYHCVNVWATFTDKQPVELLHELTAKYVVGIIKGYSKIVDMLDNEQLCRKVMIECKEDAILASNAICKTKAHSCVDTIVSSTIWNQLTEKCGYVDLLDCIKKQSPLLENALNKDEVDKQLFEQLFSSFENERRVLSDEIEKQKEVEAARKAEQERQEQERRKRNKKIVLTITPIIAAIVVFVIILNMLIIPSSKYKKAISLQESGDYYAAIELYNDLGNFKDANSRCIEAWGNITSREMISAGYEHTVAVKTDGTVIATGNESYGRNDVSEWNDIIAVSAGVNYTLGLKSDGTVVAVGAGNDGECEVADWKDIVSISTGIHHSVGLKSDGTVIAIGSNSDDECEVEEWSNIVAIAAGDDHTVGLKENGTVVATGTTKYGRCDVEDWHDIVAIYAADAYTIGLKSDGTIVTAGTGGYDLTIEIAEGWSDIVSISADNGIIVGLKSDGTVVATGDNDDGQCDVSTWNNIVAVATGYYHTLGLKSDGTVVATGSNQSGQCNVSNWKDIKIPLNSKLKLEDKSFIKDNEYDAELTWYNIEFASSFLGKELDEDGGLSMGTGDYEVLSNDMYLFGIPGRFSHGMSSADSDPVIVDILDWITTESVADFDNILNPLIERYGDDYRVQHYKDANGDAYMWKDIEIYEYVICWENSDGTVDIRWTYPAMKEDANNDLVLDESLEEDLDKMKEYASYIKGNDTDVLKSYPNFEDDGDTYYQCEDQLFGIAGFYKFEYFEGQISSVRFTWIPDDWHTDEEYVVDCLKKCFGDYTNYVELLEDEWLCYSWDYTNVDNLEVSYYIAEDEGEIIIRVK